MSFADGIELSALLAKSSEVERCFASRAASYGLGRAVVEADRFSTESAVTSYAAAGAGMRDLLATLAASRTFRYRSPAAGEVLQYAALVKDLDDGRALKLGKWAGKTSNWQSAGGIPHNRLLASLSNAMDVPVTGFGAAGYDGTLDAELSG